MVSACKQLNPCEIILGEPSVKEGYEPCDTHVLNPVQIPRLWCRMAIRAINLTGTPLVTAQMSRTWVC